VLATTAASYLGTLNPEQRRAVEHGVTANRHVGAPLLVIAGAGSSAAQTLAGSCWGRSRGAPRPSRAAFIDGAATARSKKPSEVWYVFSFLAIPALSCAAG
jgi:hypothetical protein